ncbi:hypothetical protein [Ferruginibacter albus]|nr:hypothetical protein [Ferruginibacter albus]UAY52874.1 hypothetical protein K9M53_04140 [Ferruginibacter albus]
MFTKDSKKEKKKVKSVKVNTVTRTKKETDTPQFTTPDRSGNARADQNNQ